MLTIQAISESRAPNSVSSSSISSMTGLLLRRAPSLRVMVFPIKSGSKKVGAADVALAACQTVMGRPGSLFD